MNQNWFCINFPIKSPIFPIEGLFWKKAINLSYDILTCISNITSHVYFKQFEHKQCNLTVCLIEFNVPYFSVLGPGCVTLIQSTLDDRKHCLANLIS